MRAVFIGFGNKCRKHARPYPLSLTWKALRNFWDTARIWAHEYGLSRFCCNTPKLVLVSTSGAQLLIRCVMCRDMTPMLYCFSS
ncbi:hypothetical protein T440DRAFT_226706 [Plenodomus tracheiphilus IPT5]|uniref:Uncharacterized protein n=1 Tax=Plenodomus tracheiphilus IPT5 TaxID=1408161 RepID=A0A6A7ATW2_9PLEO|nr:hypothetical protein T440DRAFT_226706 [Plenodomus tracheiphilus IPT5]